MMQFKKARLSLALAAALVGGMGTVNTASAAVGPDFRISEDGLGQALIFPYYTVRDGYRSLFNITNTSGNTVAVKVRFRESHNSRDVLDFNIVLSPFDVWTGWLEDSATGPVLKSEDKSCTSPMMTAAGFAANNFGYTAAHADSTNTDIDRAREGYVEVIMMGYTDDSTSATEFVSGANVPVNALAYNAKHVAGIPRDCTAVDKMFLAGSMTDSSAKTYTGAAVPTGLKAASPDEATYGIDRSGDPAARAWLNGGDDPAGSPLKGNFTLLQQGLGAAGGTSAIAVADFFEFTQSADVGAADIADTADSNLVTAQQAPYYLEPTLMSTDGLWTVNDDVVALLQRASMINEWANNDKTGASVSWVVTMPMKNFYVDYPHKGTTTDPINAATGTRDNLQAAMNTARGYTIGAASGFGAGNVLSQVHANLAPITAFSNLFNGVSNVTLDYNLYDREETTVTVNTTTVSPQPPSTAEALKYEVNVLTFDSINGLSSKVDSNISVPTSLKTPNGWLRANLGDAAGIPAVGFMWKKRDFGDPTINYGQITDHAYGRAAP